MRSTLAGADPPTSTPDDLMSRHGPDLNQALRSARLTLEPIHPSHAKLLYERHADERMWSYEPRSHRATSVAELERRFTRFAARRSPDGSEVWLNYAVRLTGGPYVGTMQATITGSSSLIGYTIFADHWRQGYGKEGCARLVRFLFEEFGVRWVRATVDTENAASIALLEHIGFQRTWTGPSDDMPGRFDHRYELQAPAAPGGASAR